MEEIKSFNEKFFNDRGYAYIKDVLTKEQRIRLASIMLNMKEQNQLVFEGAVNGVPSEYYNTSFGGNHPEFEQALREVQPRIESELNVKLNPKNSFARIYYNGGSLKRHTDREGLEYTLSLTLYSNLDTDWPLWCIDKTGQEVPINIYSGDGAIILGTTLTHWRETLECKDDQFVVQLFMHWEKQ